MTNRRRRTRHEYVQGTGRGESALALTIRDFLDGHRMTQDELAHNAGIPTSTLNSIISRGVKPEPGRLRLLTDAMGIPFRDALVLAGYATKSDFETTALSEDESSLLYWYRSLPDDRKHLVYSLIEAAGNFQRAEDLHLDPDSEEHGVA